MLAATLQTPTERIAVRVRDVSQTGVLLISPVQPPTGSNVAFVRGAISVAATVVRVEGSSVALRFREAIDKTALLIAIGKPAAALNSLMPLFPEEHYAASLPAGSLQRIGENGAQELRPRHRPPVLRQVHP